jgi:hypothetical protein
MHPKTFFGWYNRVIRGHPYNEKTAHILDTTFRPSPRLLSTLVDRKPQEYQEYNDPKRVRHGDV